MSQGGFGTRPKIGLTRAQVGWPTSMIAAGAVCMLTGLAYYFFYLHAGRAFRAAVAAQHRRGRVPSLEPALVS